jgi:hypothetical protein
MASAGSALSLALEPAEWGKSEPEGSHEPNGSRA